MPQIPIPRQAGLSTVRGPRTPRVGPPATTARGVADVGQVLTGIGEQQREQQAAVDRVEEERQAQIAVDNRRAADAAAAQAQREAEADAKLAAGNAAVRYELESDRILRGYDDALSAGKITADDYQGKVAGDLRKLGQEMAKTVPESGRRQFEESVTRLGAKNVLAVRNTLDKHGKDVRMGRLVQGAADLERLAVTDLPRAQQMAAGLFGEDGPYAAIEGREKAAAAHQKWKEGAARAHYQRRIADSQDDAAGLAALRKEVGKVADLDPMQQSAMLSSIDSRRAVLENRASAAAEKRDREASQALTGLRTLAEGGFPVSASYASEVAAKVKGTAYAAEVGEILKGTAETAGFASKPVPEQERIVAEMTAQAAAGGVDPESSKRLERMQKVRDQSRRDFAGNPWQAAADRGQIDEVAPLDTSSVLGMVTSLEARLQQIDTVERAAGGPVSPLQPDEATGMGQMLASLPVRERAEMLGRVRQTIGPQRMRALAGQLAKDDPTLAVVAAAEADGLKAPNGESVGALILRGQEAIAGKQVKVDDMAGEGIQMQMREYLGDAITSPVARDAAVSAAIKVWAARQVEGDSMDYEEAIEAVTGAVVEWGGGKVLAPVGWTEDEFRVAVEDLSALRLTQMVGGAPLYVGGQQILPKQIAEQMESIQLRQGTGGRYALQIGGAMVTDGNGAPVYLKLSKPDRMPGFFERTFGGQ